MADTDNTSEQKTIQIPLTQGYIALVDEADADLAGLKWRVLKWKDLIYARKTYYVDKKQKTLHMHRVILERVLGRSLKKGEYVDHKDHNTLNNCRSNLRLASNSENQMNKRLQGNNTSGHKGVCWLKREGKWVVYITINRKGKYVGLYEKLEDAAKAYNEAALKHFGEFAWLNTLDAGGRK